MKRLIFTFALLFGLAFLPFQSAQAQSNTNPGPANQNCGPIGRLLPISDAVRVLRKAAPEFNVKTGRLVSAYASGNCQIEPVRIRAMEQVYLVSFRGGQVIIAIDID